MTAAICHAGADDAAVTPSVSSSGSTGSQSTSTEGVAFIVSGAGTSLYNGEYKKTGTKNGKPKYRRVGHESASVNYSSNHWYLCHNFSGAAYKIKADEASDPNRPVSGKEWTKCSGGELPVPTISYPSSATDETVLNNVGLDNTDNEELCLKLAKTNHN